MSVARLPAASYHRPWLSAEIVRHLDLPQIGLFLVIGLALLHRRAFARRWPDLPQGRRWQPWILLIVAILAWTYASYDYNYYFDQSHVWDRLALLVLAGLVVWRPIFLLPFVLLVIGIATQFEHPIGGFSVVEQFVLVRILILFIAAFLGPLARRRQNPAFAFLLLTLVASSYWWPGLGKLRLLWFTHGHVSLLLPAAYASGWLRSLAPETIVHITRLLSRVDPLLMGFTLLVECGALFFLWRRSLALALLLGWVGLHLGIAAVSGIFFWKWILVDLGLFWLLLRDRSGRLFPVFGGPTLLLALLLIGGGRFWYDAVNLSWYDSTTSYVYRLEGKGESGTIYPLPPRFFAPYGYQFSLGGFGYLVEEPRLNIIYGGIWDRALAGELLTTGTADDIMALEAARGQVRLDEARAADFADFIRTFVGNLNTHGGKVAWPSPLQAPSQLLSSPYWPAFRGQEALTHVTVYQVTSLYSDGKYHEFRKIPVAEIEIAPTGTKT